MIGFDLHTHSTASDGLLEPAVLVRRAAARGVRTLALTDHDDVAGLAEARAEAVEADIELVDGVELSVTWREQTLHVVGLHVDPTHPLLTEGLARIREGRETRAQRIADSLAEAGVPDAYAGAMKFVTSARLVSRTHFARYLVEQGYVRTMKDVFRRYLSPGKPGHVRHRWAALEQAIAWIRGSGGQAVLAHPGRYPLSNSALRELLEEFRGLGGEAIEVLTSSHTPDQAAVFAGHARHYGFRASAGSDFHGPGESWLELGSVPSLPGDLVPVWASW